MTRMGTAAAILAAALLTLWPMTVTGATTIQQLRQDRQHAQTQLNATKSAFYATESAVYQTQSQITSLSQTLTADQRRAAALESRVQTTRGQLSVTEGKLAQSKRRLSYEVTLMAGQVRLMEEHGSVGYLDVVLGANSFSQFISRLYLMGQLAAMAGSLVNRIHHVQTEIAHKKTTLTRQAAQLVTLEGQARQEAVRAQLTLGKKRLLSASLKTEESQQLQLMQSLTKSISHYNSEIAALQSLLNQYRGGNLSLHNLYDDMYPLVSPIAAKFSLPPALIIAVITEESGGNANAVSTTNAIGLMQVEPGTAQAMGFQVSALYNPKDNVVIGCTYLSDMLNQFGNSSGAAASVSPALASPPGNATSYLSAALAAYNAGPGAVESYGLAGLFAKPWGVQRYVANIERLYLQYTAWGTP